MFSEQDAGTGPKSLAFVSSLAGDMSQPCDWGCPVTGGSDGKESACSVGYPGSIPGLGRSPGEGDTHSSILAWKVPWTEEPGCYSSWGRKESDMTEQPASPTPPLHSHVTRGRPLRPLCDVDIILTVLASLNKSVPRELSVPESSIFLGWWLAGVASSPFLCLQAQ